MSGNVLKKSARKLERRFVIALVLLTIHATSLEYAYGFQHNSLADAIEEIESRFARDCEKSAYAPTASAAFDRQRKQQLRHLLAGCDSAELLKSAPEAVKHYSRLLELLGKHHELCAFLQQYELRHGLGTELNKVLIRSMVNSGEVESASQRLLAARLDKSPDYDRISIYHVGVSELFFRRGDVDDSVRHLFHFLDAQINRIDSDPVVGKHFFLTLDRLHNRMADESGFQTQINRRHEQLKDAEADWRRQHDSDSFIDIVTYRHFAAIQHAKVSFLNFLIPTDPGQVVCLYLKAVVNTGRNLPWKDRLPELVHCNQTVIANSHWWSKTDSLVNTLNTLASQADDEDASKWLRQFQSTATAIMDQHETLSQESEHWPNDDAGNSTNNLIIFCSPQRPGFRQICTFVNDLKHQLDSPGCSITVVIPTNTRAETVIASGRQAMSDKLKNCRLVLAHYKDPVFQRVNLNVLPAFIIQNGDGNQSAVVGFSREKLVYLKSLCGSR